ncbi:hypothetical protein pb186bvf_017213 [Paramecium bursaria]
MKQNQKVQERQMPFVCGTTKISNDLIDVKKAISGFGKNFGKKIFICYVPLRRIPLQLISVHYDVQINNGIAVYNMVQQYENNTNEVADIEFLFQVPANSVIIELEARLGNTRVLALIKEKEIAKVEYQQGIDDGKTMLYSDYNDQYPDIVKAKLGNLGPQEKIQITYKYIEQLQVQVNEFWRLQIDPVVHSRYSQSQQNYLSNFFDVHHFNYNYVQDIKVVINMDLEFVKSPSHQIEVEKLDNGTQIKLFKNNPRNFIPSNAFILIFQNKDIHQPQILVTHTNDDRLQHQRYCATVQFIPKFNPLQLNDAYQAYQESNDQETNIYDFNAKGEYIFVLDRSGSMAGKRIEKAIEALRLFLQSLPLDSYFNIVSFGSTARRLNQQSQKYDDQSIEKTFQQLATFNASMGGTEIKKCLEQEVLKIPRIKGYPRNIFLLTDGEVDPEPVLQLITQSVKPDIRFYSLGIGNGCSQYMIEKIAFIGNGLSHIVTDNEDLNQKVIDLLQDSITPFYQKFNFETNLPNQQVMVSNVLDVNCIKKNTPLTLQILFKENDMVDGNEQYFLNISYQDSENNQYGLNTVINLKSSFETDYFHKLAVGKQIQQVLQNARLNKQEYLNFFAKDVQIDKQTIIDLSLTYQILSPYTAFICEVVELQDDIKQKLKQKIQHKEYIQRPQNIQSCARPQSSKMKMSFGSTTSSLNIMSSLGSLTGGREQLERKMLAKASAKVSYESQKRKKPKMLKMARDSQNVECDDEAEDFNDAEEIYQEKNQAFQPQIAQFSQFQLPQQNQLQQPILNSATNLFGQNQQQKLYQGNYMDIVSKFNLDGSIQESVLASLRIKVEDLTLNIALNLQILIAALVILEQRFNNDKNSWILIFNKGIGYLKRNNIIYNNIKDQMIALLNLNN